MNRMADNGNVIDKLSIEIDGDISGAKKNIDKIKKTLGDLQDVFGGLNGIGGDVGAKLKGLADGFNAVAGVNTEGVKKATNAIKGFAKVDFSGISSIPSDLSDNLVAVADGVNVFTSQIDSKGLKQSISSLNKLKEFDFKALSDNVNNLDPTIAKKASTFMEPFKTMQGDFTISDNLSSITRLFAMDFTNFTRFMETAQTGLPGLASAIRTFAEACGTPEFQAAIDRLSRLANVDLTGLANLSANGIQIAPDVSGQIEQETAETEEAKQGLISTLVSMFTGNEIGAIFSGIGTIGKGIFGMIGKEFDKLKAKAHKLTQQFTKLGRSIGRIAMYRSIRFVLNQIAQGFKEGTDNLYQYSKAINGEFAKSMDLLTTDLLYFRNSVAAATAPLINYLAPAIDYLTDRVVEFLNWFNELTAKLTGASYWTKALKYPKEYAEATKDASKALKDFQMGFDELNVISDNGSSSVADALDYSKMFTEMKVDIDFEPWADAFREAIEKSDFYGAGAILGNRFNEAISDIPADEWGRTLGEKINNAIAFANGFLDYSDFSLIGSKIAEFLNSGIDEINFYEIGHTIGQGINQIVSIATGFVDNFDFSNFGSKLASGFNGIVDYLDFDNIVYTIQTGLWGILDTANRFLEEAHFEELGEKIGTALGNADVDETLNKLGTFFTNLITGAFDFVSGLIGNKDISDWSQIGMDIVDTIFPDSTDSQNISKILVSFWNLLKKLAIGTVGIFTGGFFRVKDKIEEKIDEFKGDIPQYIWDGFSTGIAIAFGPAAILRLVTDKITDPFLKDVKSKFGISSSDAGGSTSTQMAAVGIAVIKGFKKGIQDAFNGVSGIKEWIQKNIFDKFIDGFNDVFWIKGTGTEYSELLLPKGMGIIKGFKDGVMNELAETIIKVREKLKEFQWLFDDISLNVPVSKITGKVTDMKDSVANTIGSIASAIRGKANDIWLAIEQLINGMIQGFNHFADQMSEKFTFHVPDNPIVGAFDFGISIPHIPDLALGRFDNGGFPTMGELFMANENGVAEMVGRIGNRTAVANNDQIVAAVAEGVAQAVASVLNSRDNNGQNINIYLDSKQLAIAIEKQQRTRGKTIYQGGVVNA